jgi:hypothetical protein
MLKLYQKISLLLLLLLPLSACQDNGTDPAEEQQPSIEAQTQGTSNGNQITVSTVFARETGWVVVHRNDNGSPGAVIGNTFVESGSSSDVQVQLEESVSNNEQLWVMLHNDTGTAEEYEFSGPDSPDQPVVVDGAPVATPFTIQQTDPALTRVPDQVNKGGVLEVDVNAAENGWIVLHRSNEAGDAPAQVIGHTMVSAGENNNVFIPLNDGESVSAGEKLFVMLHYDTGTQGEYEFAGSDTPDQPVVFDGNVVTKSFTVKENQSQMTAEDQTIQNNSITVDVGADADGWVVVHRDADGAPNAPPIIGQAPIVKGENNGVTITFGDSVVSDNEQLWPMVHFDTGTVGEYEFGGSDTPDQPMVVDGNVLTKPITVSGALPDVTANDQDVAAELNIAQVDAEQIGWIVLHRNDNGSPGAVFGHAQVYTGENGNVAVMLDEGESVSSGEQVWAMLHIDNGTIHEYEFDGSQGSNDPPVTDDLGNPTMDSFVVE